MKSLLILLAALTLSASAALAQTVLPSGGVAPTGGTITPGTVPGSQPLVTPPMHDAGSPRARRHDEKVPGMSRRDEKQLRKMGKVKPGS